MRVVRDFQYELGFTEAEVKDWNIENKGDRYTWDGGEPKEIDVGDLLAATIIKRIEGLSDGEKVTPVLFTIYDRLKTQEGEG